MPSTASFWTIINAVYDSGSAALRMNLSYDHTHSSGSGSGGQLDWDVVWSDAVHSHGTDTEGGQLDHGAVFTSASLLDDDHPQYQKENLFTAAGDMAYASGSSTWTKLSIGSPSYTLVVNDVGTGIAWAAAQAKITSGSYTGDTTTNRAIAHNLAVTPKSVFIARTTQAGFWYASDITLQYPLGGIRYILTAMDATSFYVGTAADYAQSANNVQSFEWTAIG